MLHAMSGTEIKPCIIPDAGHVDVFQEKAFDCIIHFLRWLELSP